MKKNLNRLKAYNNQSTSTSTPSACALDQWLAGLIDGDGCFYISAAGQLSCEITVHSEEAYVLYYVQKILACPVSPRQPGQDKGSIKPRANSNSVRLRITKTETNVNLIHRINGHVRIRWVSFTAACKHLQLKAWPPLSLEHSPGYVCGLFDADGCITITLRKSKLDTSALPKIYSKYVRLVESRGNNQLSVHIDSNHKDLLEQLQKAYGFGTVFTKNPSKDPKQRRPNVGYRWLWRDFNSIGLWLQIAKGCKNPAKKHRLGLLPRYFELKARKAHLAPQASVEAKLWKTFCKSWFKIET